MSDSAKEDNNWHLDKKVPIALLAAIGMQLVFGIWWASKSDSRLGRVEEKVAILERNEEQSRHVARDVAQTLATLRAQQDNIVQALRRIENMIDVGRLAPNQNQKGTQ